MGELAALKGQQQMQHAGAHGGGGHGGGAAGGGRRQQGPADRRPEDSMFYKTRLCNE